MSDLLRPIASRALRIAVALLIAGLTLHGGFHALRAPASPADEAFVWDGRVNQDTRITRAVEFDINDVSLSAQQTIMITGDLQLCRAIDQSVYQRQAQQGDDATAWVTGRISVDGSRLPFDSVAMSFDDAGKPACTVTARSERGTLFRDEAEAVPSDMVRFTYQGLGADDGRFRFLTNGVGVSSRSRLPQLRTGSVTDFEITSAKRPVTAASTQRIAYDTRNDGIDFRVTRLAQQARPRVRDVMTRVDEEAAADLNPWLTALLNALPFALFIAVMRRRHAAGGMVEMAEWLLVLVVVTHLASAIVHTNDGISRRLDPSTPWSFLRHGAYGLVAIALACAAWPLMAGRWIRRGVPSRIAAADAPRPWLPVVCIAAAGASLGTFVYSLAAAERRWPQVMPEVIAGLAVMAFVAACLWIVREAGGRIVDALVAAAAAIVLYLTAWRFETLGTYALAFSVLLAIVLVLVRGFASSARMSRMRSIGVVLGCAAGARLLVGEVQWGLYGELDRLLFSLEDVAILAVLAGFLIVLRDLSRAGETSTASLDVGFVFALLFLWRYRWGIYGLFVLAAGYLLLRYWLFQPRTRHPEALNRVAVREAICQMIALREAERALDALGRSMRKKVGEAASKWKEYEEATKELETVVADKSKDETSLATSRLALTAGPSVSPWDRGTGAALYGALLAVPWVLLYAADLFNQEVPSRGHWWLTLVASLLLAAIQWPLTAFFFGYFYPNIRGGSGLTKGLTYFGTIVVPPLLGFMLFEIDRLPESQIFGLWICQNFIQAVLVGLSGDYRTLRDCGLSWRHLRDVHNLGVLTAYGSSVIVAFAGAISAAVASGATGVLGQLFNALVGK